LSVILGRVAEIWFYPVKSMAGIQVESAYISLDGLLADRQYAFVQAAKAPRDSFPWMTAREYPRMITYRPRVAHLPTPDAQEPAVEVTAPAGICHAVDDPALRDELEKQHGPLFLIKSGRGNFDAQHVSLFSLATVRQLAADSGAAIDHRQFRANLFIEPASGKAFDEENWAGKVIQIGEHARIAVTKRDGRCMIVNLNPDSAEQDPRVLRTIAQQHESKAGVYGNVMRRGQVKVGDEIRDL